MSVFFQREKINEPFYLFVLGMKISLFLANRETSVVFNLLLVICLKEKESRHLANSSLEMQDPEIPSER